MGGGGGAGADAVACLPSQVAIPALSGSNVGMEFCLVVQALRAPSTASSQRCLSRSGCFLRRLLPLKSCLSLLRTLRLPFLNSLAMARSTSSSSILVWKLSLVTICSFPAKNPVSPSKYLLLEAILEEMTHFDPFCIGFTDDC